MNIQYDRQALQSGQRMRQITEEAPGEMATYNGADMTTGTGGGLAARNEVRKAGPGGVHAMRLMNDPTAAAETNSWMEQFGQSNQGSEFNAAKTQQAEQVATLNITNQELGRTS